MSLKDTKQEPLKLRDGYIIFMFSDDSICQNVH